MKSQGKDVVVSARKPARRGWGCVSFFRRGTAGVVAAGGMVLGGNAVLPEMGNAAQGAFIYEQNDEAAKAFGRSWADVTYRGAPVPSNYLPVPVPSVRALVPGVGVGFADRSITWVNQSTLVSKYHAFEPFLSQISTYTVDLDPDGNFSGPGTYKVEMVASSPGLDLVVFKPYVDGPNGEKIYTRMIEGPNLEIGDLADGQMGIGTGVGNTRYVGTPNMFTDRLPRAFYTMSNGEIFGELDLVPTTATATDLTAIAIDRYSGGGIYTLDIKVAGVWDNVTLTDPNSLSGGNGASRLIRDAEYNFIMPNAQIVPEPASLAAAAAAGFGLLAKRRRRA